MIDINLSCPDPLFDHALTLPEALILPADCDNDKQFAYQPIGTGPYRVAERQAHRLVLEAFDDYFGYRALTDQIQIMVFDEAAMCYLTPSTTLTPERLASHQTTLSQKLEMDQAPDIYCLIVAMGSPNSRHGENICTPSCHRCNCCHA